jgi:rod shape-determining protein MreD
MVISFFLIVGIGLLVLQTSIFPLLPTWLGRPDPLFVLIVYAALRLDVYQGAILTLVFSLLLDIFSGPFLGLYPVTYLPLFVILKTMAANLTIHETSHQVPLTLASYLFAAVGLFVFASLLMPEDTLYWSWRAILVQLFLLAILTIPLFQLYDAIWASLNRRLKNRSPLQFQTGNRFKP